MYLWSLDSQRLGTTIYMFFYVIYMLSTCNYMFYRVDVWREEVPMLLRDPAALLIQMVLTMPHTMSSGTSVVAQWQC